MKKTFLKNLLRDIKKSIPRFLSIVIIIALGVAFYGGVRAASPDMKISIDNYLKTNNFMDFKIVSILGITKDDVKEVRNIKGVKQAEGSYSVDGLIKVNDGLVVVNINSMPDKNGINRINIIGGRTAENLKEAVVEEKFLKTYKLNIGDYINISSGNELNIKDKLKNNHFKIVGIAQSPMYISAQRQISSIGNGDVKGFVYITPEVFKSNIYTEMSVKSDLEESDGSLLNNKEYKFNIAQLENKLKNMGINRSEKRYKEVLKEYEEKTSDEEIKLNAYKDEDLNNIFKGYKELEKSEYIQVPEWYILGRNSNVGYENFRQDSDRIDNIGRIFPIIFFMVAALVSLTAMTRMVQENRKEIGTLVALGYSKIDIVLHYLIYSYLASFIGSIIGMSFGFKVFPPLVMRAYSSLYTIPNYMTPFNVKLALESSLLAIFFITLSSLGAVLKELKESPMSLMRPKPPKDGKTIFLEKINFIWQTLSFMGKITVRNIFRYKVRFFMTLIGIAACTGLIITGFGLREGITRAIDKQFYDIYRYDMQAGLGKNIDNKEKENIKESVIKNNDISSVLFTCVRNASVNKKQSESEEVYIVVPESKDNINKYIDLNMKGKPIILGNEGVVITEKLSKLLKKAAGDYIQLHMDNKNINAKISAVTEQYVQHYIYMSPEYYKKIINENIEFNNFYGVLKDNSKDNEQDILNRLREMNTISFVSFKKNNEVNINKSIDSINSVVLVLIISSGILSFIVIYTLTDININERKRELCTMKLLGFYDSELAFYVYKENIILTIGGGIAGVIYGIFINKFIVSTAETNVMLFVKIINPVYYIYSFLITILFSIIVNIVMYKRFKKINMIESLKSIE